jgi:flavin prenyltransferase
MTMKHKIILGITGASGSIYAKTIIDKLTEHPEQIESCGVVFSEHARAVWDYELGITDFRDGGCKIYSDKDFFAPFASGSAGYTKMIVCPCTMGTLGKIANGITDSLITRAADVILKEKRTLILVTREMPLNLIHINNMKAVTEAGGIICPASPSFYSKPGTIDKLIATVVDKVLSLAGFSIESYEWGK